MSFTNDIKSEICKADLSKKAKHCLRAELSAIVDYLGNFDEEGYFFLETDQEQTALYICRLIDSVCGFEKNPEIFGRKRTKFRIWFREECEINTFFSIFKVENQIKKSYHKKSAACEIRLSKLCCKKAFIRGSYLVCGFMSEPDEHYRLEFRCGSQMFAEKLAEQLRFFEVDPKITIRKETYVVYVREGSQVSDILRIMGTHSAILAFENVRITREVRGSVNRKVNCETANINRTIAAAQDQLRDIRLIQKRIGLENIPKELEDAAKARLTFTDASLQELGMMMNPPVGKSGIKHRFDKIKALADGLKGN